MIQSLLILDALPQIAKWSLLIADCILLYRQLSLPTLPWLAAHYALTLPVRPLTAYVVKHVTKHPHTSNESLGRSLSYLYAGNLFLSSLISLLVVVLLLSEVAHFVSIHYPNIKSRLLSRILFARRHVTLF